MAATEAQRVVLRYGSQELLAVAAAQIEHGPHVERSHGVELDVRAVLYLRSQDGKELLATVAEDDALRFGRGHRPVWARLAPERFLAFDPASGARLAPAAA